MYKYNYKDLKLYSPSGAVVSSGPELLPRAMSWFVALQQPGSGLISGVPVITEGHVDDGVCSATPEHVGV